MIGKRAGVFLALMDRIEGPEHPATFFVAGALNEVSHHATQICVLRDLYAARRALG